MGMLRVTAVQIWALLV